MSLCQQNNNTQTDYHENGDTYGWDPHSHTGYCKRTGTQYFYVLSVLLLHLCLVSLNVLWLWNHHTSNNVESLFEVFEHTTISGGTRNVSSAPVSTVVHSREGLLLYKAAASKVIRPRDRDAFYLMFSFAYYNIQTYIYFDSDLLKILSGNM